ncbi:hypothetical protein [Bradyrhizobium sp. 6(2017)]|uniref:hypothetical protein n=1 Tax=Bradyrhizobium sp. 6(2017) TaxID=1197460 RepID=UPI002FE62AEA
MALHFRRVDTAEDLEIWIASSDDYSFVISSESRSGPGLMESPVLLRHIAQTLSEYARGSSVRIALRHVR